MEATPRFELGVKILQTSALPLGYAALWSGRRDSNPRPSPWQGDALPLSHFRISFYYLLFFFLTNFFFKYFSVFVLQTRLSIYGFNFDYRLVSSHIQLIPLSTSQYLVLFIFLLFNQLFSLNISQFPSYRLD